MSKEEIEESLPKVKDDGNTSEVTNDSVNQITVNESGTSTNTDGSTLEGNGKINNNASVSSTTTDTTYTTNNSNNSTNGNKANKFQEIIQNVTNKVKEFKGNKNALIVGAIVLVLVILLIFRGATSSPKSVYKGVINNFYNEVHSYLKDADKLYKKYDLEKNAINAKGSLKFDTSIKDLKDYTGYKYELNGGLDIQNKLAKATVTINGNKDSVDGTITIVDDKAYFTSTLFSQIIDVTEEMDIDNDTFTTITKNLEENDFEFNIDDYDYVVKTIKDAIIKNLDSKYMKKKRGSFEIDDKTIKATKITYTFDEDSTKDFIKGICEELLNNDKFLKILADTFKQEKSNIKDILKDLKAEVKELKMKDDLEINIFTKGLLNKVVGFNISIDDDEYVSLYNNNKNFEFTFNDHSENDLVVTGVKNKNETEVSIKYNKEKIGTLNVREISSKKVDFDFKINSGDENISGNIYFTINNKKDVYSGEYKLSFKQGDDDLSISGDYSYEIGGELTTIDTKKAVTLEDVDFDEIENAIEEKLKNDDNLKEQADKALSNVKKDTLDLNYYGMIDIYSDEEALKVLSKQKATVLYIGNSYYYDDSKYNLFSILKDAQKSLDFYSYHYYEDSLSDELREKLKDVASSCSVVRTVTNYDDTDNDNKDDAENDEETNGDDTTTNEDTATVTTTCDELPVIFLIKDGKAVKALRENTTKEQLIEALAEIGID